MRKLLLVIGLTFISLPLFAQNMQHENDPTRKVEGSGTLPKGWELRFDHPSAKVTQIKFEKKGNDLQFTSGPAAIYYETKDKFPKAYIVQGYFVQEQKTAHPEAYGLFVGGDSLQSDSQHYLYFLVRQDGKFLIKSRNGSATPVIVNWTSNPAVRSMNSKGKTENFLSIVVLHNQVDFLINGKHIRSISKSKLPFTEGYAGLRINHNLDVLVQGFRARALHD